MSTALATATVAVPLRDTAPAGAPLHALHPAYTGAPHWLRRPGAAATVLIHGAALLAVFGWSSTVVRPPAPPPVVELIRIRPEPPREITPPQPQPARDKVALSAPRPVAQPQAQPRTVDVSAAQAEAQTPPAPPVQAAPPAPVVPAAAAPVAAPAPAAPRQIATEGIPTDYVNQVYARINRNADYPREARMRRQQGKVGYRLTLNPDGTLVTFDIQSSGVEALDEAARDAIRRAAPFPRLPDLGGSSYLLAGNIVFKIN
jgi:protein TonB